MTASERALQDQFSVAWKYYLFDICSHPKPEHGQMQSGRVAALQPLEDGRDGDSAFYENKKGPDGL
jgi:hypothetical protein